jgi:hypothetical protein
MYRLHIDIPLGGDEDAAINAAKKLMEWHFIDVEAKTKIQRLIGEGVSVDRINYRLGHDDDRQKSNYLMKNEEGHVNNKKCRLTFENNIV